MPTWFITGCSSGFGRSLGEAVLAQGQHAVVTARDASSVTDLADAYPDTALPLSLDVTDPDQVRDAVLAATDRFGAIDVLVNNAGYGYRATVEEREDDQIQQLFKTNVFGAVELIKAIVPGMRSRRRGAIVNISSIGARIPLAGVGYYAASKAALEGISRSLAEELAPIGVTVTVVEPGAFRTDFGGRSIAETPTAIPDYDETVGKRSREQRQASGHQPGDPVKGARAIIEAVESTAPPRLLVLGEVALAAFEATAEDEKAELQRWRSLSLGTEFDSE